MYIYICYIFQNSHGLLCLEISNVQREDSGMYSIKALNTEGEIACSAGLEVQGK